MEKPLFSVLVYNLGGKDFFHDLDPSLVNPNAEYVYVTDGQSITSNTWTVRHFEFDTQKDDTMDACYKIRFNPFNYVNGDVVIRFDASLQVNKDLTPLYEEFIKGNYESAVLIHNERQTILDEYLLWCHLGGRYGGFEIQEASRFIKFMSESGYDVVNYKGLYCGALTIHKKDYFNFLWTNMAYLLLKTIKPENKVISRNDQTVYSFILNNFFSNRKILPLDIDMLNNDVFTWYEHKNGFIRQFGIPCEPYLFNKPCKPFKI